MDKEILDSLWGTVLSVGKNSRLEYGAMVTLGSVFGDMRSAIEKQQEEIEKLIPETQNLCHELNRLEKENQYLRDANSINSYTNQMMHEKIESMKQYIKNGIEFGYIDDREGDYKRYI